MVTSPWTEEHGTTVVKHWEQGLSAAKIAIELSRILGTSVTRNMVMGKWTGSEKTGCSERATKRSRPSNSLA